MPVRRRQNARWELEVEKQDKLTAPTVEEVQKIEDTYKHECEYCGRKCKTACGLKIHMTSCDCQHELIDHSFTIDRINTVFETPEHRWYRVEWEGYLNQDTWEPARSLIRQGCEPKTPSRTSGIIVQSSLAPILFQPRMTCGDVTAVVKDSRQPARSNLTSHAPTPLQKERERLHNGQRGARTQAERGSSKMQNNMSWWEKRKLTTHGSLSIWGADSVRAAVTCKTSKSGSLLQQQLWENARHMGI